ncbi:MAG: hypothetical protein U9R27_06575 [Campylobacterota bacterium]|nr:hypothetical protein [Campylobacterota bacterium]
MKIIGHPWVESELFVVVDSVEKIRESPAGSILLFDDMRESIELLHYCRREGLPFAVRVIDLKMALFAHALNARYIIAMSSIAVEVQALAQNYLFDTQIVVEIADESQIEIYAKQGIDGVIFSSAIL